MSETREKILDGLAWVAGEAAGLAHGAKSRVKNEIETRVDDLATRMDLVPREDYDRLEAMVSQYRIEQIAMKERIETLEKALSGQSKK